MKLPNSDAAGIAQEKIRDYLLNAAHPDNGGKAPFFLSLGFQREDWSALAIAFRELARTPTFLPSWNQLTGRSIFSMVVSSRPAAGRLSCGRFGLLTVETIFHD